MAFWTRQKLDPEQFKRLQESLRNVGNVQLPAKDRQALKRQLFGAIERSKLAPGKQNSEEYLPRSLQVLGKNIQEVGARTNLSISQKVKMRERMTFFIRQSNWLGSAFAPFKTVRFWRTALSSALLLFFVTTTVIFFPLQVPLTYAARMTYIEDVSGEVYVLRAEKLIPAQKDFSLQEGDIIITKANSFASIRFFDDSVSRLDSNTELEVKRLYSEPFNPVATQVELLLDDGHVWTRVLNLIDEDSHFMVSTKRSVAIVTNKAAFDLQTQGNGTTLSVFDNVVDFALGQNYTSATQPVVAGFQAQVSQQPDGDDLTKIVPVVATAENSKIASSWVQSNLAQDQVHSASLVAENQQALVSTTGLTDVLDKSNDSTDVKTFTNPQIEQERLHFLDGYDRLILGETYLVRQQQRQGMQLILEFEADVRSIMIHYPDYQNQDPLEAGLLYSMIESKIAEQRKDLATLLPGDTLYPAKEELENAELFLAGSDVDKAKVQLSQSEDKLLEAQDLIEKGNFDQANQVLIRYQRQIDNLVLKVNGDNTFELHDKLVSLFEQQIEQIKVLTAIEKTLVASQPDLLKYVRDLRQEVLKKLMSAFEKVDGTLPVSLIQELRDLLQTYMVNGAYDQEFVTLLNNMIVKYDKSGNTKDSTQELPSQLGVLTIVEVPASPTVQSDQTQNEQQLNLSDTQQLTQQSPDGCDITGC